MHHLNYTQGLVLFGIPVEDRDQFIADNDVWNMSQRELRQTISESGRTPQEEDLQEYRVDPVKKEVNRKEALKIATNMVETLTKYPPRIKTNLNIKRDRD